MPGAPWTMHSVEVEVTWASDAGGSVSQDSSKDLGGHTAVTMTP